MILKKIVFNKDGGTKALKKRDNKSDGAVSVLYGWQIHF
jgi:hypothetical protein